MRPLFNYTKISVQNREECNPGQSRCGHLPEPTGAAVPVMAMQPVQLQMTAYQPVMMTQFVQSAPQMVAMPQMVQPAPQLVSMPPVHQVMYRPQQLNPQAVGDDCNLNNVCEKLAQLRDRVASLESRLAAGSEPEGYAVLEQRVTDTEKAIRLQTEILDEIRHHLKSARE